MSKQNFDNYRHLAHQRKLEILSMIEARETVANIELMQKFGVSNATITRDMKELEEKGMILRIYGGATSIRGGGYEFPFLTRETRNLDQKKLIAAYALRLVQEGETIILDVGTTINEFAKVLRTKTKLTVIVTSIPLAQTLATQPGIELIVIGGKYRHSEFSMVGNMTEIGLKNFYVDKAFISAAGIHPKFGVTEHSYEQAGTKKVIIEQAKTHVLLADNSKFGKIQLAAVCPLSDIEYIITDCGLPDDEAEKYKESNLELIKV